MKLWLLLAVFMPGAWLWADEQAYPEAPAATNVEEQAIPSVDELEGDYESPDSLPSAPQASNWEPTAVALPADMDPGDNKAVRRFVKKQLNMAEEAADKKHWETVSEKVALLEELRALLVPADLAADVPVVEDAVLLAERLDGLGEDGLGRISLFRAVGRFGHLQLGLGVP